MNLTSVKWPQSCNIIKLVIIIIEKDTIKLAILEKILLIVFQAIYDVLLTLLCKFQQDQIFPQRSGMYRKSYLNFLEV